jgi:hypothetical protein
MVDNEKLKSHIKHLEEQHDGLDKEVREMYIRYGDDALVKSMKKRKLLLKDEIENFKKQLTV